MTKIVINWKKAAKEQWNKTPCGEISGNKETLNYFLSVERNRYDEYASWMKDFFLFSRYQNKKVLEIGYGQGTDLCQFALAGAECFGIDITERHFELAKRNLNLRGLHAELFLEDANNLHFESNTFDVVYSFGVLHHTPDTIRCLSEAYRVLKPGGELIVTLYHKYSAFYLFSILLFNGILKGKLKKLGLDGLLSIIEKGADGINIKPLVKLYTSHQLRIMLSDFNKVSIHIKHLERSHFSIFRRIVPLFIIKILEKKLGWYIIGKAIK
ncbi:MAG: class I SAM-dependent methyltransferase [Bacteroidales bacterium]|nr:class I SAM-dependent methyltransferase [Bacteroidales bacterium]